MQTKNLAYAIITACLGLVTGLLYFFEFQSSIPKHTRRYLDPKLGADQVNYESIDEVEELQLNEGSIPDFYKIGKSEKEIQQLQDKMDDYKENYPGPKFITLKDSEELGLSFYPTANLISSNQKYAVITSNILTKNTGVQYFFNIPIACQAWRAIGYGCFIIIPYSDRHPEVEKGVEIVKDHCLKMNKNYKGSVVILDMKVEKQARVIQMAQIVRLFAAHLVKYSTSEREWNLLKNTYFMTTDVDILPLSTKIYHDSSHDWNILSPNGNNQEQNYLYMALACIGASADSWTRITEENKLLTKIDRVYQKFNSSGIIELADTKKRQILSRNPGKKTVNWYMDQILAGVLIKDYLNKFGWSKETLHENFELHNRIDRKHAEENKWALWVDKSMLSPFKDTHICRQTYAPSCFWNVIQVLSPLLAYKDIQGLIQYRSAMLDEFLANKAYGTWAEKGYFRDDEKKRQKYLEKYGQDFDTRNKWTQCYPKIYSPNKPRVIDWSKERVFKKIDPTNKTLYFVIPNDHEIIEEYKFKYACNKCQELFLQYKKDRFSLTPPK